MNEVHVRSGSPRRRHLTVKLVLISTDFTEVFNMKVCKNKAEKKEACKAVVKIRSIISASEDDYAGWCLGTFLGSKGNVFGIPPIREELQPQH